jgi:pantetheine-phosphate adenylyltransferase
MSGGRAIVMTSANPLHYGHVYLYREAGRIFGVENVKVAIGKTRDRNRDIDKIIYHLNSYKISYVVEENTSLEDYCRENSISHIVRGIRNMADAGYELKKLDFVNRICPEIQTVLFPAQGALNGISSSLLRELLGRGEFDIAKNYMDEDSMYRFLHGFPEFIVFFGKACSGKTYYLRNTLQYGNCAVEVDRIFWKIFERHFGHEKMLEISSESKKLVYRGEKLDNLISIYSTENFWKLFFDYIRANFPKVNFSLDNTRISREVFIVDFPSIGSYWSTIGASLRGRFYLVKLCNSEKNRKKFAASRGLVDRLDYLDLSYREPDYFDIGKTIDE